MRGGRLGSMFTSPREYFAGSGLLTANSRYVTPGQPPIRIPRAAGIIRRREVLELRREANAYIQGPLGNAGNPMLINPAAVIVPANVGIVPASNAMEIRFNNRVLRAQPGRINIFGT
jgi:hypothetical protein